MNGYNGYEERPPFMERFLEWAGDLPMVFNYALAVIGGVGGFIYGLYQPAHHPQYLYAIVGATVGFIVIQFTALLITYFIQAILFGLLGLAVYYAYFKP